MPASPDEHTWQDLSLHLIRVIPKFRCYKLLLVDSFFRGLAKWWLIPINSQNLICTFSYNLLVTHWPSCFISRTRTFSYKSHHRNSYELTKLNTSIPYITMSFFLCEIVIKTLHWSTFYKKILFHSFYFEIVCLIPCITYSFFVINCEICYQFLSETVSKPLLSLFLSCLFLLFLPLV